MLEQYNLKLPSFFKCRGAGVERIENMENPKGLDIRHSIYRELNTYVSPSINFPGFSIIPTLQ
jgi:hypothetical protein